MLQTYQPMNINNDNTWEQNKDQEITNNCQNIDNNTDIKGPNSKMKILSDN